jgi:hypothetical protein
MQPPTRVEIALVRLAEAYFCRANEVLNRNALARKAVVSAKDVNSINEDGADEFRGRTEPSA